MDFISRISEDISAEDLKLKVETYIEEQSNFNAPDTNAADENDTLHIGLCMAGAVSAGAYTAGMMDYLIETLERWEKARQAGEAQIPQHKVMIDVMAGASAGGMTAAIAAAALQCNFPHVNFANYTDEKITKKNRLFDSWVNLTGRADMLDELLDKSDLEAEPGEASHRAVAILNSSFINAIANDVLLNPVCDTFRPYISKDLDVWLALSNINGLRHQLKFHSLPDAPGKPPDSLERMPGENAYISYNYRDFVHFRVTDNHVPAYIQQIDFKQKNNAGSILLRDAAMATGAFPVALAARLLKRPRNLILRNPLYKILYGFDVTDDIIRRDNTYVITDGGMMNNEPFEVTRILMHLALSTNEETAKLEKSISEASDKINEKLAVKFKEISKAAPEEYTKEELHEVIKETEELRLKGWDHSSHDKFTRTVILVDPFPSHSREEANESETQPPRTQITEVLKGLVNAATGQLLFKVDDIEEAYDYENFSRFLIVPKRRVPANAGDILAIGSDAIACGAMGGFSGFFHKEYRIHDFLLGRRNCQRFLQRRFLVPEDTTNPIFLNGYQNGECRRRFTIDIDGRKYLPIIPDIDPDSLNRNEKVEHTVYWPNSRNISTPFDLRSYLYKHRVPIANRLSLVAKDLFFRQLNLSGITRQYLALPFRWPFKIYLSKTIIEVILERMEKHHLR